jgi:hypothetical protein
MQLPQIVGFRPAKGPSFVERKTTSFLRRYEAAGATNRLVAQEVDFPDDGDHPWLAPDLFPGV